MRLLDLKPFSLATAALFAMATPARAQHNEHGGGEHGAPPAAHGGGGPHFQAGPPRGPAPHAPAPARPGGGVVVAPPPAISHGPAPRPPVPREQRPHVEPDARWVGHEGGPGDERYRVGRPYPHGHFSGPIGRGHTYRLRGWDPHRHRFWFNNAYFLLAPDDLEYADDWSWNSDDVVMYDDPDHPGWYLAYNTRLGTYVHVEYEGAAP
jgi:hypothetical protein